MKSSNLYKQKAHESPIKAPLYLWLAKSPFLKWREKGKLTQREAALVLGVSVQSFLAWETGVGFPRRDKHKAIKANCGEAFLEQLFDWRKDYFKIREQLTLSQPKS